MNLSGGQSPATTPTTPIFDPRKFVASSTAPREEEDYDWNITNFFVAKNQLCELHSLTDFSGLHFFIVNFYYDQASLSCLKCKFAPISLITIGLPIGLRRTFSSEFSFEVLLWFGLNFVRKNFKIVLESFLDTKRW